MNLIISNSLDPYSNLAIEEILLKNSNEDFVFLYVNRPCVVIGKHQIALKEVNARYINENNILITRRLSGGGTVFHDEGNLNFSTIQNISPGVNISYKEISKPIIEFLRQEGADVHLSERNDILLSTKKVSGSAMHIYKNRVLAHSTLLIDCNLKNLSSSLDSRPERFTDKSISSVRARVINLSEVYPNFSVQNIINQFKIFCLARDHSHFVIPENYSNSIDQLVLEKYSNFEWIYGYSPKYNYKSSFDFNGNKISYNLDVEKGIIKNVKTESVNEVSNSINLEINNLIGRPHNPIIMKSLEGSSPVNDIRRHLISSLF